MRVKVKICGITNLEDAIASVITGCDALGFVFYRKSPRYINPHKAKKIIRLIPKNIVKIGVFVNSKENRIKRIARVCNLDMLQFHGSESPGFCRRFSGYKIIKAFRVKDKLNIQNISRYKTFAYLFDTFSKSKAGGTGKKFNWELLAGKRDALKRPVFLSGGLNFNNIGEAIKKIRPAWVDVSSSVELKPGKKSLRKLRKLISKVNSI